MSTFPLRLPDHVMRDAKRIAERGGTSLNQLFLSMISERIGAIKALEEVERRAAGRGGPRLPDRRISLVRPEEEDGPDDGEAEAVLGGLQGEGRP